MLSDIEEFQSRDLPESDICIIGAGPAGLDIALTFANTNYKVTLLEGGHVDFDWQDQNLHRIHSIGRPLSKPKTSVNIDQPYTFDQIKAGIPHIKQFGGGYKLWNGIWKSFDPADFQERSFFPLPSWPISLKEIARYYKYIANDYFLRDMLSFKKFLRQDSTGLITDLPSLRPVALYQITPRLPYEMRFLNGFKQYPNMRVILGANAIKLNLAENCTHVNEVVIRSLSRKEWGLKARYFILCCGAIGNARLLLYSNDQVKEGIGNGKGLVGRNLICSLNGLAGMLVPFNSPLQFPQLVFRGNKRYRVGICLHSKLLKVMKIPNHCSLLEKPMAENATTPIPATPYFLRVHAEQIPNRDSRVYLSEHLDKIGIPIPNLDWQLSEKDQYAFKNYLNFLTKYFYDHHIGRLLITEETYRMETLKNSTFLGTTRMGATPQSGVVDSNCKVFGIDNLYCGGASIFPTSGNVNPYFQLLAMSRRLSSHLLKIIEGTI